MAYFAFVEHYGADGIWYDQWSDVRVIGHPTLGALWGQFNEGRLFFPRLIDLLLADVAHFDIHTEAFLSAAMLVAAVGLVVCAHRRRARTPWPYYLPFVLVMLSFVQAQNSLWGFQMAWYLVMLAFAVALILLDGQEIGPWLLVGAIGAAIVGSYSSFQGLLIWPVGLVLLYCRHRSPRSLLIWIGAAVASIALFFVHYNSALGGGNQGYAFSHPSTTVRFFFTLVGETVGQQFPYGGQNAAVLVLGVVIVAVAVWVVIAYGFRQTEDGTPVGVALILFGLSFAVLTTIGRVSFTVWAASGSRYTTFDLLIPAGCYLALLERAPRWAGRRILQGATAAIIALLVVLGTSNGITQARSWHSLLQQASVVTANIDHESDEIVEAGLSPGFSGDIRNIRRDARIAQARHLSVFRSGKSHP